MSNIIKYQFVNLDGKDAVLIDNNKESEAFTPLTDYKVKIQTISEIEAQKALSQAQGEFEAGVPVTNFDKLFQEQQEAAESRASAVIEKARKEADRIREEAQIAADAARSSGYEEGKQQGYQEGLAVAEQEIQQREEELAELARQQKEELAECISAIEVKYVDIVIALVKKLTGVVLEDKEDLILYLIQTTAGELEASQNYKVRVSPEDVYFLEARRKDLLASFGEDVTLEFVEEKGLEKGQCIIETDKEMVDCSFQTQLDTLVRDLKMLVH